jgi:hypothetical protein
MRKQLTWFSKHTQQAVMSRASTLSVIARTGPTAKSGVEAVTKKEGEGVFIVGQSVVGGGDRIGRKS